MFRKTVSLFLALLFLSALAVFPVPALYEREIESAEQELSDAQKQLAAISGSVYTVTGTIISTDPEFCVNGIATGENAPEGKNLNFIIRNPEKGKITGDLYYGVHLQQEVRQVNNQNQGILYYVMGATTEEYEWLSMRCRSLREKLDGYYIKRDDLSLASYVQDNTKDIALQIGNPYVNIYGKISALDSASRETVPVLIDGTTYLPIRALIEGMGGTVSWYPHDGSTRIVLNKKSVTVLGDNHSVVINGKKPSCP